MSESFHKAFSRAKPEMVSIRELINDLMHFRSIMTFDEKMETLDEIRARGRKVMDDYPELAGGLQHDNSGN